MSKRQRETSDPATADMLEYVGGQDLDLIWDRYEAQQPQCGFGGLGLCCRICSMGPCRIDPFGRGPRKGICGATADVICARNLGRMIAAGSAAHSDHARDVAHTLLMAATDENCDFEVKDERKLKALADELGVEHAGKDIREVAKGVAEICLAQFGQQEGEIVFTSRAPEATRAAWKAKGIVPRGIDREVVEMMHRTNIGVDNDAINTIRHGCRTSLADGWGGSMISTELTDVLFNMPMWNRGRANLAVLGENTVNLIVHGHEPTLSEMVVAASQDKELIELAKSKGAEGISLAGMCCTANEILMRHGIPLAGNFMQQELAIATGAVEAMVVDVQCILPSLGQLSQCFHTIMFSSSPKARFPEFEHVEYDDSSAYEAAKGIIRRAIENYPNRDRSRVHLPPAETSKSLVAGFTAENVFTMLGGTYRSSYRPLNDAIIAGRIRGLAAVVGCNNPHRPHDTGHLTMIRELLANDVLVASTGCTAQACGKAGLLTPEAVMEYCGKGLKEVCEAVGIPPVLHLGACVDNSRILIVLSNVVAEGGLGESIADLPAAAAAPEWMSEKAVAIGFYAVASGALVVLGVPFQVQGAPDLLAYLTEGIAEDFGGKFAFEDDPIAAARLMIDHIDSKREALKLAPPMFEQPYAPRTAGEPAETA